MSENFPLIQRQETGWYRILGWLRWLIGLALVFHLGYWLLAENFYKWDGLNLWKLYIKNMNIFFVSGYSLIFYYGFSKHRI